MATINQTALQQELNTLFANRTAAGQTVTDADIATILRQANVATGEPLISGAPAAATMGPYKMFTISDDIVSDTEIVTSGLWSGGEGTLSTFFTSSTQVSASGKYYWNVYQTNATSASAEVQFAVTYGHVSGSGSISLDLSNGEGTFPTTAIYGQYRTILLESEDTRFEFLTNVTNVLTASNDIYVINFARSRYREKVDAGNIEFDLSGSNGIFTFIDDSGNKFNETSGTSGRVFNIVSGSLNLGSAAAATVVTPTASNNIGYGLFYPDQGIVILNPTAIHNTIGTSIGTGSVGGVSVDYGVDADKQNHALLYNALKGGSDFEARRTETISTTHYFVRVHNREFNYSNNPTFRLANGRLIEESFVDNPKVYITTVGLYNNQNELLAVGKVSQPILKDFSKELLVKIRLDF
jgi:hypothetical protein